MNKLFAFILLIFTCILFSCDQQKKKVTYARIIRDLPVTNKVTYPDGKLHLLITYQHGALSKIEYFNRSGKYDSIAFYKRGQKNSVIHFQYDNNGNYLKLTFTNGMLTSTEKFDVENNLLYKEPVAFNTISHSQFLLKSGKNYIDKHNTDTLFITNKDLPVLNRALQFIYFLPKRIGPSNISEYIISPSSIKSPTKNVVILVYIHQQNEHQSLLDSLIIPVH